MISTMSDWLLHEPLQRTGRAPSGSSKEGRRSVGLGGDMADTRVLTRSPSKQGKLARNKKPDEMEFRLIFMVSFVFFLIAVVITRCLPRRWRLFPPASEGRSSIIREAKMAADSTIPYAFMG